MRRFGQWISSGIFGGFIAGAFDGVRTLLRFSGTLSTVQQLHFILLGACLGAVVSGLVIALYSSLVALVEKSWDGGTWFRPASIAAALLSTPLIIFDSFALFKGAQATRIPGHNWLSIVLIGLGIATVLWISRGWMRLVSVLEQGRRRSWFYLSLLGLLTFLIDTINRGFLPRLYAWFHLTLSIAFVLGWILLVHAWRVFRRARTPQLWTVVAVGIILVVGVWEFRNMRQSQALQYFTHEKSQVSAQFVRLIPKFSSAPVRRRGGVASLETHSLPEGPKRPGSDVIVITLDAVRADHLSSHGYARRTTPNLDALAAKGVRFRRAYTQAPHTSFALASLMTGKYFATLSRILPAEKHDTLALILRRYGWKTAAFFPPAVFYIDAQKMKDFEADHFDFEFVKYEYLSAEGRIGQIAEFLDQEHPQKLFLWLHLFEAHEPYDQHPGFEFGDREVDRYDSEIAYVDSVLGKVIELIKKKRPSAIVIVSADHGEEFGEHGGRYHGTTLFEEQVNVPLVLYIPGVAPRVVEGPVQVIDIPTTILGLLDLPLPTRMRGRDLGPWLADAPAPNHLLPPVFSEVEDKRMVVVGTEKLICALTRDYCSLFDLATDPEEKRDLADAKPQRVEALRGEIEDWLSSQTSFERHVFGPEGSSPEVIRLLERAGFGDGRSAIGLAGLICGTDPLAIRVEAAKALVSIRPPREDTRSTLTAIMQQSCEELIQDYAATVLYSLGEDSYTARLKGILTKPMLPTQFPLYAQIALVLGEKKHSEGLSILSQILDRCETDILLCRRAIQVLGKLGTEEAASPLLKNLARVLTRRETVIALGQLASPSTVPALIERLNTDEYVPVRMAAASALGRIGGARVVAALYSAETREKEKSVRDAIRDALAALGRLSKVLEKN
jgi:glucan phosphoethanolaminetransferase (alkaline phosphatase superfamily)